MLAGLKGHWKYPVGILCEKVNSENLKCLISIILTEAMARVGGNEILTQKIYHEPFLFFWFGDHGGVTL